MRTKTQKIKKDMLAELRTIKQAIEVVLPAKSRFYSRLQTVNCKDGETRIFCGGPEFAFSVKQKDFETFAVMNSFAGYPDAIRNAVKLLNLKTEFEIRPGVIQINGEDVETGEGLSSEKTYSDAVEIDSQAWTGLETDYLYNREVLGLHVLDAIAFYPLSPINHAGRARIADAVTFSAEDDSRYVFNGVCFALSFDDETESNVISVTGTDGRRLYRANLPDVIGTQIENQFTEAIIPAKLFRLLSAKKFTLAGIKILKRMGPLFVEIETREGVTFYAKAIDGLYPDAGRIISDAKDRENVTFAEIKDPGEFAKTLENRVLLWKQTKNLKIVRVLFQKNSEDRVKFSLYDSKEHKPDGESFVANPEYMRDALKTFQAGAVIKTAKNFPEMNPVLFLDTAVKSKTVLVMPVKMN